MKYSVLVYDRLAGKLLRESEYEHRSTALQARFDAEVEFRGHEKDIEIVVLGARTRSDLLRTHARYFLSAGELAQRIGK